MSDLFQNHAAKSGPVECLGQTFPSDEARREHYLKLLAEKLKDPAFRKTEGFPIGSDEDILALSDPPYYTACPNPFIEDFVRHYGKPYDSSVPYSKEPFAADVSEGKNDPIYNAHSYHTKVPHKAIMRYILHYTQPGDIVFDGFCGTGMTGVAAQLCGDRKTVESLGYRVDVNEVVYQQEIGEDGKLLWKAFSKLGPRRAILNDLSPAATFISYNYNTPIDIVSFKSDAKKIIAEVENECGWMYQTLHLPAFSDIENAVEALNKSGDAFSLTNQCHGVAYGRVNYTVWSEVFTCPDCVGEVVFWKEAVDMEKGVVRDAFPCPHCAVELTKRRMERAWITKYDKSIEQTIKQVKQVPVLINYSIGKRRFEKTPDAFDFALLAKIDSVGRQHWFPNNRMMDGGETRRNDPAGLTHAHHFFTSRASAVIAAFMERARSRQIRALWAATAIAEGSSMLNRERPFGLPSKLSGTLYVSSMIREIDVIGFLARKIQKYECRGSGLNVVTSCQSSGRTCIQDNSLDYVFIDPPFGGNLNYAELNFLWEQLLRLQTNVSYEAIESKAHKKTLDDYRRMMTQCFREAFRILKPGRWMTVEFSNTQAAVWNAIQTALQEAGFVVANVSALDKKQGSFKAVTTTTAVKQDLVISAYKPNGGLEDRFSKAGGTEDSVWDFVRTHLKYLPCVKISDGKIDFIAERDPRIIFDRLVAWFVRHGYLVPISSQEFQAELCQRFEIRDGMVFLSEQVSEYDKKRAQFAAAPQMELFVSDERSAIDWLSDFLKRRPSTYQELHPEFISQLGAGWKKHESKPELSSLLEDNFLKYDGSIDVPSQIHSYLSTNHKDLRGLEKNDPGLVSKAMDRWYVPDPSKAQDLERKREKSLLKEFEAYASFSGRRFKELRLEVLRAGFKDAWSRKDYQGIISLSNKIPDEVLQQDEKLLLLYDQATTRLEAN